MPTAEVNPHTAWPRVRTLKEGTVRVAGRATRTGWWLVLRWATHLAVSVFCLWLLAAALLPVFVPFYEEMRLDHPAVPIIRSLIDLRLFLRELLMVRFPSVGELIRYDLSLGTDFHLILLFILLSRMRSMPAYILTQVVAMLTRPIMGKRFKLTFTPDAVVIHRHVRSLKLNRHELGDEGVTFRVETPQRLPGLLSWMSRIGWLGPSPDLDCPLVVAVCGRRVIPIAAPPHMPEAQRIVESFHIAMNQTRA